MKTFVKNLDKWLRSRIRQLIWKRWKKLKTRIKELRRLGLSRKDAYTYANTRKGIWRTAHSKTLAYTLTNQKLEQMGLMNMSHSLEQIQSV